MNVIRKVYLSVSLYNLAVMKWLDWLFTPHISKSIDKKNFFYTQLDAIGVGVSSAAVTFLPVFLSRLYATNLEVSLLTSMPAFAGLLLAIPFGRFLEKRKNIIPWYSYTRLIYLMGYALSGLIPFFLPQQSWIISILIIWGIIAIPQTILSITFSVLMSSVGGDDGRYELMSRRWAILGLITALFVFLSGLFLRLFSFPLNYQLLLILLSSGAFLAVYSSNKLKVPDLTKKNEVINNSPKKGSTTFLKLVWNEKPFLSTVSKRIIYLAGMAMGGPLFPLYYVRSVKASDGWIAAIGTIQTAVMVIGYFLWMNQSRSRGSRSVLIWTTLTMALYPILVALTQNLWLITFYAALAGLFQAGMDLVMFDDLMKTIPVELSSTFVAIYQSLQYLTAIVAPLLGSIIADKFGLAIALIFSGVLKLIGFILLSIDKRTFHPQTT
jgi:MFS family permease